MAVGSWVLGGLAAAVLIVWLGFQIQPTGFKPLPFPGRLPETVPIPDGLPAPVDRFLRVTYGGDRLPRLTTVVLSGRARMRPAGPLHLPARFRFVHRVGHDYRHYFEATWFGLPLLTVDEGYVDGASFFASPHATLDGVTMSVLGSATWFDQRYAWASFRVDDVVINADLGDYLQARGA